MNELIETIKLAGVLVLAIPPGLAGIHFLLAGRLGIGLVLIGLAVALIAVKQWLSLPTSGKGLILGAVTGSDQETDDKSR